MKTGLGSLVIANGGTTSDELGFNSLRFARSVALTGDATAQTGTISVQVNPLRTGGTFTTLQSGGADVTLTAQKTTVISPIPAARLRLVSSSAEAAERRFTVTIDEG